MSDIEIGAHEGAIGDVKNSPTEVANSRKKQLT